MTCKLRHGDRLDGSNFVPASHQSGAYPVASHGENGGSNPRRGATSEWKPWDKSRRRCSGSVVPAYTLQSNAGFNYVPAPFHRRVAHEQHPQAIRASQTITSVIASEIGARPQQVTAAVALLDEGATVPFIARYRKEVTDGLDDTQLRQLAERLIYLRELEARREAILSSIGDQGKLTDDLHAKIAAVTTKAELEDIYLPYKPKRRTKADIARENGLAPLAEAILADRTAIPTELAEAYLSDKVADAKAALDGARDILSEQFAENADLVGRLRTYLQERAFLRSRVLEGKQEAGAKFSRLFRSCRALVRRAGPSRAGHAARPQ